MFELYSPIIQYYDTLYNKECERIELSRFGEKLFTWFCATASITQRGSSSTISDTTNFTAKSKCSSPSANKILISVLQKLIHTQLDNYTYAYILTQSSIVQNLLYSLFF